MEQRVTPNPAHRIPQRLALRPEHRREIVDGSGVDPDLAAHFFSVTATQARALGFSEKQAGDGWAVEYISPTGEVSYQLKRDEPRPDEDGDPIKYETPARRACVVDTGTASVEDLQDVEVDLVVLEGSKKAYCARTRGWIVACLAGVWNGTKKRKRGGAKYGRPELLPDWDAIALEGRKVYIAFDADYREKRGVALAIMCLAWRLMERGAHVYIISLPGTEMGLDDYAVAGGDLEALKRAARPYQACDFTPYVATGDRRVVATVEALRRRMALDTWEGKAGKTDHSYMRAVLELALERGKWGAEGVEVVAPTRETQDRAAIGSRTTLARADARLVERGYLVKRSGDRATGKANRYILNPPEVDHIIGGRGESSLVPTTGPLSPVYVPHMRWPAPPAPEDAPKRGPSTPLYALGKAAEFALDRLVEWGGRGTVADLATASGYSDVSKFRADVLEDLERAGVISLDEKRKRRAEARITQAWRDRLDERREHSGEFAKARRRAVEHRNSREEYYNPREADPTPELRGKERNRAAIERHAPEWGHQDAEKHRRMVEPAVAFVRDTLNPLKHVRLGLLEETWRERGGQKHHLRLALRELRCKVKRHAEHPGELFVYPPPEDCEADVVALPRRMSPRGDKPAAAPPAPVVVLQEAPPEPDDDWRDHPLDCECLRCTSPIARYATAWTGSTS